MIPPPPAPPFNLPPMPSSSSTSIWGSVPPPPPPPSLPDVTWAGSKLPSNSSLVRRLRMRSHTRIAMTAKPPMPPTTPPTMAPVLVFDDVWVVWLVGVITVPGSMVVLTVTTVVNVWPPDVISEVDSHVLVDATDKVVSDWVVEGDVVGVFEGVVEMLVELELVDEDELEEELDDSEDEDDDDEDDELDELELVEDDIEIGGGIIAEDEPEVADGDVGDVRGVGGSVDADDAISATIREKKRGG
ncbi:hypothetical protein BDZ97DRAFT_1847783 [Flammula alnicola]|nr:hypothetical protein BDZ97DRAFT_1847783 [Flammula alnicola]